MSQGSSTEATANQLEKSLKECGLFDQASSVGENMYQLGWGSATVVCVARGSAVVAIAPMFDKPPEAKQEAFFRKLLELNGEMGGTASFAVEPDGSVVLHCGRGLDGLDPHELKLLLSTVGKFADDYDDLLKKEFYP